ncbi:MAG: hypothetical protein C4291_15560 [Candidatus Dadabacteria bacterium]
MRFALKGYPLCDCAKLRLRGAGVDEDLVRVHAPPGGYWSAWVNRDGGIEASATIPCDLPITPFVAEHTLRNLCAVAAAGHRTIRGDRPPIARWREGNGEYVEFELDLSSGTLPPRCFVAARFWGPQDGWEAWRVVEGVGALLPEGALWEVELGV